MVWTLLTLRNKKNSHMLNLRIGGGVDMATTITEAGVPHTITTTDLTGTTLDTTTGDSVS